LLDGVERRLLRNFDEAARAQATHLTGRAFRTLLGLIPLAGTVIFVDAAFRPLVAAGLLNLWLAGMAVVILTPLLMTLAFAILSPGTEAETRPYVLLSHLNSLALSALIAISVWLLLPHAGQALQMLMVVLYVTFIAMMLGADTSPAVMVEQLCIMASLIAFVLTYRLPYALLLAVVLGTVTISLIGLHRLLYRSTRIAVAARAEAERANAALKIAVAQVAAERDAKTRFIAAASHDLRQPIQAAALYMEHALSAADQRLRERAAAGAKRAFGSVDTLLDTMLDHLRLEAGAAAARIQPVELGPLLANVVVEHGPAADLAGIRLTVVRSSRMVSADPAMLTRVLGNVIANAIRHSGGRNVLIGTRQHSRRVTIWVIDDGVGIDMVHAAKLFEDYVQGQDTAPGGFGIGLSSSRRMVQLMNGEIGIDPRWRRGAAFRVSLPAMRQREEERVWKAA